MERALERIEKLGPILERKQMGLQFEGQERKRCCCNEEVSKGFAGRSLFEQANLHVRFQERLLSLVVMVQGRLHY